MLPNRVDCICTSLPLSKPRTSRYREGMWCMLELCSVFGGSLSLAYILIQRFLMCKQCSCYIITCSMLICYLWLHLRSILGCAIDIHIQEQYTQSNDMFMVLYYRWYWIISITSFVYDRRFVINFSFDFFVKCNSVIRHEYFLIRDGLVA